MFLVELSWEEIIKRFTQRDNAKNIYKEIFYKNFHIECKNLTYLIII